MLVLRIGLVLRLLFFIDFSWGQSDWHDDYGPWYIATKGEPWPMPNDRQMFNEYLHLDHEFDLQVIQKSCDILKNAKERYKQIIEREQSIMKKYSKSQSTRIFNQPMTYRTSAGSSGNLAGLKIFLNQDCESYPRLNSNESYALRIPHSDGNVYASLTSDSIWGILRGLETFSQLIAWSKNGSSLLMKKQIIEDLPRFAHRGLLLDTSRHFFSVEDILKILDAMSYNKLNVFHWHIIDGNSFPWKSVTFPELSEKGAYYPTMVYKPEDVKQVIEFARLRGIRVVPEFDTPGHTISWGQSHPELLTPCYGSDGHPSGKYGPMDPTRPAVLSFVRAVLSEVATIFPDEHLHLGGDEVLFDCWRSNPNVSEFVKANHLGDHYEKLEELFVRDLLNHAHKSLNKQPIVWQEVFDNGLKLTPETVVHVWTGDWKLELQNVTVKGQKALLSACWYLSDLASGGDWAKFYDCDPLDFRGSYINKKLVIGGEACMWGEYVDSNNIHSRIWPRASAVAERLWSNERQEHTKTAQRLEEHACRMNRRDISAQPPNGSGFCLK
ncbi:hypothetical protein QAD02_018764 [Eretmocerus hayati]|uniref:Uncharacterized protein n=1 Tax=Eretmocerus hayati TaxID=131215 RepID=A0ACC2PHW8_9HYME|nr:hypothetical protein QAD02_018764 [Eretmocerus hayati]